MQHLRTLACALGCGVALAAPASAGAAVSITSASIAPSTTQAGAHPNVTITTAFGGLGDSATGDDVKSVTAVLPQGLLGDPNAAPRCNATDFAADACPADTKVGTTSVQTTAKVIVDVPLTAPGDVYNLAPTGTEAARLGIVVRPLPILGVGKIFLQGSVTIGPDTGYGLATTFDNLPREAANLVPIRLDAMDLTLSAFAAKGPFMTNPTSCAPATLSASVTSYDAPTTPAAKTASFTPTGCDALPFTPRLEGSVGSPGQTASGSHPPVATSVILPAGGANMAKVSVTLPVDLGADTNGLSHSCPPPQFATLSCPADSTIGHAVAASPLAPAPLTGPVILGSGALPPPLAIPLTGAVPLTLRVDTGLPTATEGLRNTIAGLPDLPVTRFDLALNGGAGALLQATDDLCRAGARTTATAQFTSHSGKVVTMALKLPVVGCAAGGGTKPAGPRPKGAVSLKFAHGVGSAVARFTASRAAAPLKTVRLALPAGVSSRARASRVAGPLRVYALGRRLRGSAVRVSGRTLTVKLAGQGARQVSVRWAGLPAVGSVAKRLSKRPRLTFVARLLDSGKRTTTLRLKVRPSVRR